MSNIIAGLFETIGQAERAAESLRSNGFAAADVCHFANNPPGRHDRFPIGGDEDFDPVVAPRLIQDVPASAGRQPRRSSGR